MNIFKKNGIFIKQVKHFVLTKRIIKKHSQNQDLNIFNQHTQIIFVQYARTNPIKY